MCDLPLQHMGLVHVNKYQHGLQNSTALRTTIQRETTIQSQVNENELHFQIVNGLSVKVGGGEKGLQNLS